MMEVLTGSMRSKDIRGIRAGGKIRREKVIRDGQKKERERRWEIKVGGMCREDEERVMGRERRVSCLYPGRCD